MYAGRALGLPKIPTWRHKNDGAGISGSPPRRACWWVGRRLLAGGLEVVHDRGVGQGRGVAEVLLAFRDAAEYAAHDLAAARLRQVGGKDDLLGPCVRAYALLHLVV